MKMVKRNQLKIFIFTAVKNRCILHGRVFVMNSRSRENSNNTGFRVISDISGNKQV